MKQGVLKKCIAFDDQLNRGTKGKLQVKKYLRASLMVQWLRICLPMQGTQVQALVQEDPTCHGAATPVCHNY